MKYRDDNDTSKFKYNVGCLFLGATSHFGGYILSSIKENKIIKKILHPLKMDKLYFFKIQIIIFFCETISISHSQFTNL